MGLKTNKAKQAPTKESPVKVVAPVVEEDGAGPATPAATKGDKPRKEKEPPKARLVKSLEKTLERMGKLDRAFSHFDARESSEEVPNLAKMIADSRGWLENSLDWANELPDDFKAPRKSRGPNAPRVVLTVEKGDVVSIKPKAIEKYLEDDEKDLPGGNRVTVIAFSKDGKSVKCKFGDDLTYFVQRSHLCALIK